MRSEAFAQSYATTWVDRLGVWLSARSIRRFVPSFTKKRVGDFGCGFQASFARHILPEVERLWLADVALAEDLKNHPQVQPIIGPLPQSLQQIADGSLDVVLLISVLEHLEDPLAALRQAHRVLAPGGTCLINVPSWRGKWYLELSAFRLGTSPQSEMDDHKMYYDERDLWPLLVRAGFLPSAIDCYSHKFGLNTFAACRKSAADAH